MTALSLDDLAALERLAKDLHFGGYGHATVSTDDILSLISQLRAAMEVVDKAKKAIRSWRDDDCTEQIYSAMETIFAAISDYDAISPGGTTPSGVGKLMEVRQCLDDMVAYIGDQWCNRPAGADLLVRAKVALTGATAP